jgi:nucleoside diphosphate kinase
MNGCIYENLKLKLISKITDITVFVIVWLGAAAVTINAQLLGN